MRVTVAVSAGGRVTFNVSGTGLGGSAVGLRAAGVLEGRGLIVVGGRLRVEDGSVDACAVGVDGSASASKPDGRPDHINAIRIPAKSRSAIPLKTFLPNEGWSRKIYSVIRPSALASAKCAAKTSSP